MTVVHCLTSFIQLVCRLHRNCNTKMTSIEVFGTFTEMLRLFAATRVLPYKWDKSTCRLRITEGLRGNILAIFMFCANVVILIPALTLGPVACMENAEDISSIVMPIVQLICTSYGLVFYIGLFKYRYEISNFTNQFLYILKIYGKLECEK